MKLPSKALEQKLESIFPEVIGLVITKRHNKINACPINWQAVSTIYEKPIVVCIGLANECFTLENILKTKQFVYAYPAKNQLKDVLYCGTISGRKINKLKNTRLTFVKSSYIEPPSLKSAVINFECEVIKTLKLETFTIVVGKSVNILTSTRPNLKKIYALGGANYGIIEQIKILQSGRG